MGKMRDAIRTDVALRSTRNAVRLMERALLWLHEQEVIRLNRGLTVFRPAMTIRLAKERRQFTASDFAPLNMHYDEQTIQVHIMDRYAQTGLESMADALRLAVDYFVLPQGDFLKRWLPCFRKRVDPADNRRVVAQDRGHPQESAPAPHRSR